MVGTHTLATPGNDRLYLLWPNSICHQSPGSLGPWANISFHPVWLKILFARAAHNGSSLENSNALDSANNLRLDNCKNLRISFQYSFFQLSIVAAAQSVTSVLLHNKFSLKVCQHPPLHLQNLHVLVCSGLVICEPINLCRNMSILFSGLSKSGSHFAMGI